MKYRYFKAAGKDISLLGFGVMRMPFIGENQSDLDEELGVRMLRHAIDNGVNYLDTAYVYADGNSERLIAKALKDGYREKVMVADKLPSFIIKDRGDMERIFNEQLERLEMDFIDVYHLHNVDHNNWERMKKIGAYDFLKSKKDAGLVGHIGFSYHGETKGLLNEVLDAYDWDVCQIQLNYMDQNIQAGIAGYEYAASKGVGVIVMEPLKGGKLIDTKPPAIEKYWEELGHERTAADWALSWVANLPGVTTILSGMSNMAQVEENVRILSQADANALTKEELAVIDKVAEEYNKLIAYPCTGCRYCLPCPEGVVIPKVMDYRNYWDLYAQNPRLKSEYRIFTGGGAGKCVACKVCEDKCPQHLHIADAMASAVQIYE